MADSNPLKSAMTLPKKIDLKLDNESTFQTKNKDATGKSQLELEKLYTKLYKEHRVEFAKTYTGAKDKFETKLWSAFQDKNGVLLASDSPLTNPSKQGSKYGEGQPLFKVRFKDGQIQTGPAVQQQLRSWYTQIQSEGSPGTYYPLSKTKDQFFETDDKGRTLKQQIHHATGIMELAPHLESTLLKLLSKNSRIRNQGQLEYNAFSKYTHKHNIILGDKIEIYAGLTENRHINDIRSAHGLTGPSPDSPGTSWFKTKQSGGTVLTDKTRNLLKTGTIETPKGSIQLSKTSSGVNSFWDFALKPYTDLSGEAGELGINKARTFPMAETGRSKYQTKLPKDQGSGFRKNLTQIYINQYNVSPDRAALMAADAYEGIRTGRSLLKKSYLGFDASVRPGLPYSDYSNIFNAPTPTGNPIQDSLNFEKKLTPKSTVKGNVLGDVRSDLKSTSKNKVRSVRPISPAIQTSVPNMNQMPSLLDITKDDPKKIYVDELTTLTLGFGLV